MLKILCGLFLLAGLAWPAGASGAIIGRTDDWRPLLPGARALGIDTEMVNRLLEAGLELTCPGTVHDNGGVLNGWFLGADTKSFYTNAHAIIDFGAGHRANFVEPLDQCSARSYRDLLRLGKNAPSHALSMPLDRARLVTASFTPQSDPPGSDRAKLWLRHPIPGARPLPLPEFGRINLAVGEEVIMVSMRPPAMLSPEIQACHVKAIDLHAGGPGELFTDCDNGFGNSAALYLVRDPARHGRLVPIALHEGCHEKLGDHQPWSRADNTAVAILLSGRFFAFRPRSWSD